MNLKNRDICMKITLAKIAGCKRVLLGLTEPCYSLSVAIALLTLVALPEEAKLAPIRSVAVQGEVAFTLTDLAGAEMLDVADNGRSAVVVGADTATLVEIKNKSLEVKGTWTLTEAYLPNGSTAAELTSVSISPDGSYALIGVKDDDEANLDTFNEKPGKVVAIALPSLKVLGQVTVGRGSDSVAIAPNSRFAAIANEDEENEEDLTNLSNRPGTVSIIDLRFGPTQMTQIEIPIPPNNIPFFPNDPQPETIRISADSRFILVTLQENNAVARIEVPRWLPRPLSTDAFAVRNFNMGVRVGLGLKQDEVGEGNCRSSNYDLSLRQRYLSAREPDGIAITKNGRYFVTADEDNLTSVNNQSYMGIPLSPHGSRTISVFDAQTGVYLGDSGNSIENSILALKLPQRCDSKGPEPEVVDVGMIAGRTLAFVSIERSDAVTIHDITDPTKIQLLDTVILNPNIVGSDLAAEFEPEGIVFISATKQVLVSNPANNSVSLINLTVNREKRGRPYYKNQ